MEATSGKIVAVCTSKSKGERKADIGQGDLCQGFGLAGDAHGGDWHRQVSLLALESIDKMRAAGLDVGPGDFAENLTTSGLNLFSLPVGTRCQIYHRAGDCVMPREGVFAVVLESGPVQVGDAVRISDVGDR